MGMIPELESQYPEGSDITIMNTYYQYPQFEDGKKVSDDQMFIIYKDNKAKRKDYLVINNPDYTFYRIKDEYEVPPYSQLFIEREKVEPVTVPFTKLELNIAKITGMEEFYKQNLMNRNKRGNQALHSDPSLFNSDMNIEDHYRFKFANTYSNEIYKVTKGFFDIEVDGKWAKGDFVEMGECAINCVSYYDEVTDTVYTFVLRDERNIMIQELEDSFRSGKFGWNEIHKFVVDAVGGIKQATKYGLLKTKFCPMFYDSEIELIADLFGTMHKTCPDFIEGWNSSAFDLQYIIQRVINLGYNPEDILCDQSWKYKVVKNFVDTKHLNELAERGDYTFISGLPVFMDQMIQYASRRKSKIGSYKSFKLDDIGLKEANVRKLDYHHITDSVTELPWLDFKTFFLYNIMDVIVQKCIEIQTNDLEYIFSKCVVNNTTYKKGHRQTVYLINRMAADWYKLGFIIGNNCNKDNPKPPKYLGALVGDPTRTNDYSKMKIDGRAIWVCENLLDYDFKSLYPSLMGEYNIAPNTQIGKIVIDDKIYKNENYYNIEPEKYSRGGEFIENMVTDNMIEFCHRWFHLGNITEVLDDIDEFYNKKVGIGTYSNLISAGFGNAGSEKPFAFSPILPTSSPIECPIEFNASTHITSPVIFYNPRNSEYTYEKLQAAKKG